MNAFSDETCSGLQVYARPKDEESRALAESIRRSVSETAEPDNRRAVKSGEGIYVLKNNPNVSALVECGFLSNPEECKKLCEKEFQKELSFSIVCGIIKYMNETLSGV